jgi:diketogulonate reductase-like aldo/keto reductase
MSTSLGLSPFRLNDGHDLPAVGLGTFGMRGEEGVATVLTGLRNGYRLLDTAVGYGNEAEVGEAIRRSDVSASEIVITTKIRRTGHGYDAARRSIERSRHALGVDQIGLYLIHWPNPRLGKYVDTWRALVDAQLDGEVCSVGVSNFTPRYLTEIIDATGVVPAVNQVELHPHFPQEEQRCVDRDLGICTESWSPLGLGRQTLLAEPSVASIACQHDVSTSQVVMRWHHQLGCLPIPRSSNTQRQAENLDIEGFTLSAEEMGRISVLGRPDAPLYGRLWGGDPETEER